MILTLCLRAGSHHNFCILQAHSYAFEEFGAHLERGKMHHAEKLQHYKITTNALDCIWRDPALSLNLLTIYYTVLYIFNVRIYLCFMLMMAGFSPCIAKFPA